MKVKKQTAQNKGRELRGKNERANTLVQNILSLRRDKKRGV